MNLIEKKIIANRIVQSCDFIQKDWEFHMMFDILVAALEWGESHTPGTDNETYIEEN